MRLYLRHARQPVLQWSAVDKIPQKRRKPLFFLDGKIGPRIADGCSNLAAMAHDAGVGEQPLDVFIAKFRHAVKIEAGEYAAASVVAMPSRWESFGLATAEALASARPVIGFADCPGTNELIDDGVNGLLVEGGDHRVSHLVAGLRRLMLDASLRDALGARGPASVARFRGEEVTPVWEDFFARHARPAAARAAGTRA